LRVSAKGTRDGNKQPKQRNQKTMKRLSYTHQQRHAAFVAEMGGEYPQKMSPEFNSLCAELIGVDTPAMIQDRIAAQGTLQGYIENSPETYGRKCATLVPHSIVGAGLDCSPDNGEDIIIPDTSAPLAAFDLAQDSVREVSEQPTGNKAPQTPKGRGRPRHIAADEDLEPEAKQAIREAELRFERN